MVGQHGAGLGGDLDDFVVNQVGHPYQGNNYFNAGRANGLSFWESAGITAFGSGTWEYFGETNHASLNDLVNTTLGGIALGEMFHRAAWLVRDTRATGRGRMWKEIAATAIDPVTGAKRFLTGDSSRVSEKPAEMVPSALAAEVSAGVLWRGSNTSAFASAGKPFFEVDAVYGDPTTGRSRTAYDAFGVRLRFGGGGTFSEAKVRGRLLGQPLENDRFQLSVVQAYDYNNNSAYQFGAQSFNVTVAYASKPSSGLSLYVSGWGGLMALGAIDSIPLTGIAPEEETPEDGDAGQGVSEGPRYYDYGPGFNFGARSVLARSGRPIATFVWEGHHLRSLDGTRANHVLHQLRLDVTAPLRGPLGIGISGEYFDRRTYFQDESSETRKYQFPAVQRVPDMESVVSGQLRSGGSLDPPSPMSIKASLKTRLYVVLVFALAWFMPVAASSQTTAPTGAPTDESKTWLVFGGTATTLRGDCQEDCVAHGTGAYIHSGGLLAIVGLRVNPQMDAGVEVSWVPATSQTGGDVRSTFLLATAEFRPWQTRGFFLKAGMGMAFVRNFAYDGTGTLPPITDKALGVTYGAGWTFRHTQRLGVQVFGNQHVAALGDFQTASGVTAENVIGNFWSVGAALVIR